MSEANRPDPDVVANDDKAELDRPAKKSTPKGPKWESNAKDRLRGSIRRLSKPLADMIERDVNEGDTRLLVTDFLSEGLGLDKFEDLTTEFQVKGEFADYGIRIEKELVGFIEVKRVATKPGGEASAPGAGLRPQRG